jgi:hypothetical protein
LPATFCIEAKSENNLGQKLSPEAAAASTPGEIFKLFFTEDMVDIIVLHTNR